MKKTNLHTGFVLFIVITVFSLVLTACGPGGPVATGGDGTIVWIDQPMTNFMLPVAPFTLIAHAGNPHAGITQVNFLVNGVSVGSVPEDSTLGFLRTELSWNPSGPGLYTIQAQAISAGGSIYSHISYVCVVAGISSPQPWVGDCTGTSGTPFLISFNLGPAPVYFGNCPANTLQFQAKITGDTSSITGVQASWNFTNPDGSAASLVSGESGLAMSAVDATTYSYDRDFSNAARDFGLTSGSYLLYGSVWAVDSSGNRLDAQTIGPLPWLNCTGTPILATTAAPTTTMIGPVTTTVAPTQTPFIPTITPIVPTRTPTSQVCTDGVIDAVITDGSTWDSSWAPYVTLCINGSCKIPNSSGTVEWSLPAGTYTITSSSSAYAVNPPSLTIKLACGEKNINNFILSIP